MPPPTAAPVDPSSRSATTLEVEPKYPSRRAYVLKLHRDASADALAGRVENVATGWQREFASGAELLHSIACDLAPGSTPLTATPHQDPGEAE